MKTKYKVSELVNFLENYGRANRKDKRKMGEPMITENTEGENG